MSLLESFWRRTCSRSSCLSCFYAHASHEGNGRNCTPRRFGSGPFHETRNVYKCHSCDPQNRWKASRPSPSNAFLGRGQGRYQRQVGPGPRARIPVFYNKNTNKIQSKCNNINNYFQVQMTKMLCEVSNIINTVGEPWMLYCTGGWPPTCWCIGGGDCAWAGYTGTGDIWFGLGPKLGS